MSTKHTFKDWKEGKITWNTIVGDYHDDNSCITADCVAKINKLQKEIFNRQCKLKLEELKEGFFIKNRDEQDREESLRLQLKTIDNLFNKPIEQLNKTSYIVLGEKDESGNLVEHFVRSIPPLNLSRFSSTEIKIIRESRNYSFSNGLWNHEVIETPHIESLKNDVFFNGVTWAKAYSDFAKSLKKYKGSFQNSFSSFFNRRQLNKLLKELIEKGFVSKQTGFAQILNVFGKSFILKDERVKWLKSNVSLKYFITQLDSKDLIDEPFGYRKWETVTNCFITSSISDFKTEENLRKVKFSELSSSDKEKIDNILLSF